MFKFINLLFYFFVIILVNYLFYNTLKLHIIIRLCSIFYITINLYFWFYHNNTFVIKQFVIKNKNNLILCLFDLFIFYNLNLLFYRLRGILKKKNNFNIKNLPLIFFMFVLWLFSIPLSILILNWCFLKSLKDCYYGYNVWSSLNRHVYNYIENDSSNEDDTAYFLKNKDFFTNGLVPHFFNYIAQKRYIWFKGCIYKNQSLHGNFSAYHPGFTNGNISFSCSTKPFTNNNKNIETPLLSLKNKTCYFMLSCPNEHVSTLYNDNIYSPNQMLLMCYFARCFYLQNGYLPVMYFDGKKPMVKYITKGDVLWSQELDNLMTMDLNYPIVPHKDNIN